jgi:hypothetical protein
MKNINDIINEQEEVELRKLANNETALKALKKILLVDIYSSGTLEPGKEPDFTRNFALSFLYDPHSGQEYRINNDELGQKLRSSLEGMRMVQSALNTLNKFKDKEEEKEPENNPAR